MFACSSVKDTLNVYVTTVELIYVSHRYSKRFAIRPSLYLKLLWRKFHLSGTQNTSETQNTFLFLTSAQEIPSHGAKITQKWVLFYWNFNGISTLQAKKKKKKHFLHIFS